MDTHVVFVERPTLTAAGGVKFTRAKVEMDPSDFKINEADLDTELSNLGVLLYRYGQLYAELKAELARKEDLTKRTYATQAQSIRKTANPKPTEGSIKEQTETDTVYNDAQDEAHLTRLYCLMAENWWRSIQQKSDLVKALCYKQKAEIQKY